MATLDEEKRMGLKILQRKETKKKKGVSLKPIDLLVIGAIILVSSYAAYPLRAYSTIPGILIGGGIAGLVWIAYRVLFMMGK